MLCGHDIMLKVFSSNQQNISGKLGGANFLSLTLSRHLMYQVLK